MRAMLLAGIIAFGSIGAARASVISYSEIFSDGTTVTGTFNATVNGNAITDISNPTLSIDNIAITSPLFVENYKNATFMQGGAFASFDNSNNNFAFIDSDFAGGDTNYNAYFYSVVNNPDTAFLRNVALAQNTPSTLVLANLTSATAVPEPASLAVLGIAMAGIAATRRRRAA